METATSFVLENGMRFIVSENHASPACSVAFCVHAGVCEEPSHRRGIAHFVEHMMFKGSEHFGPKEHAHRIARLGGSCNAATSHDFTVYYEEVPPHGLEEALRLEADRFQRIRFTAQDTDMERKVILEELNMYDNQPMARAVRDLVRTLSGEHPYAIDPLGLKKDLEALRVEDLEEFHRRLYRPSNTFGLVCGDVDRDRVEELARKHFGAWQDPKDIERPSKPPPFTPRTGSLSLRLPFEVPLMVRAHRLASPGQMDLPALELLTALLSGGRASPIREELVKKRKLCVEAGAYPFKLKQGGLLVFFGAFLPPGQHAPRRKVLKDVCDAFAEHGPDPAAFAQHLKRFRKSQAQDGYSLENRMMKLGEAQLLEGDYRKYDQRLAELKDVTPDRVQRLARELFAPENTLELDLTPENIKWWMWPVGLIMRVWPRRLGA